MTETKNPRDAIREARAARLKLVQGDLPPATVKVYAADETMRAILRHPSGVGFRDSIGEAMEWPNDSFTASRIADGDIRTDGPGSGERAKPDDSKNVREQAEARLTGKAKAAKSPPPAA
jgi:hypothetical protein